MKVTTTTNNTRAQTTTIGGTNIIAAWLTPSSNNPKEGTPTVVVGLGNDNRGRSLRLLMTLEEARTLATKLSESIATAATGK